MNPPKAFCPQCKVHVVFEKIGNQRRCPTCGFQYDLSELRGEGSPSVVEGAVSVLGVVCRVLLIMAGLAVVGIGILFAGCAIMLGSH
jgi:hypothetical protein